MGASNTKTRSGTAARRHAFVQAYIANGHNATQAAIAAGYSPKGARVQGLRLLTNDNVQTELATLAEKAADAADVKAEDVLREAASIAFAPVPDEPLTWAVKLKALEMLFKHLNLFETHNLSKAPPAPPALRVQVTFVPSPNRQDEDEEPLASTDGARHYGR
jgi:hypothetical protein